MSYFRKFKTKNVLVVDLELTCDDGQSRFDEQGNEIFREVIEIGIVKIDNREKTIVDEANYLITNQHQPITDYCVQLTGISQEMIDEEGMSLQKASKQIIQRFGSLNTPWFGWGCGDYNAMVKNCHKKDSQNPFSSNYINLSELYSLVHGIKECRSLKKAMTNYDIEFKGQQHRALCDARAAAEVYLAGVRQ